MAVTVQEVVDAALAAVESEAGPQLVAGWISERYRELSNKVRFRHLLKHAELTLPALIDDGTVTLTVGSNVVVGTATARTAWLADPEATSGRFFRVDGQRTWYRVNGLTGVGDLILDTPWQVGHQGTASPLTGAGYTLVERFHRLESDVRWIGIFTHQRLHEPLEEIDNQEFDQTMAGRILIADLPRYWCERGNDADGTKLVEVYPFTRFSQILTYVYFGIAPVLTLDSNLPNEIDSYILKTGALVDIHRWEFAKALRDNKPEVAATWRNEMNTLSTRWDEKIRDAVKADRAGRAGPAFQLHTGGFPQGGDHRIRNAYDYVWQKGNRP